MEGLGVASRVAGVKELVIDSLSCQSNSFSTNGTDYATYLVILITGGQPYRDRLWASLEPTANYSGNSVLNMPCHLIAQPGDTVYVNFNRPASSLGSGIDCSDSLTGHYVVLP